MHNKISHMLRNVIIKKLKQQIGKFVETVQSPPPTPPPSTRAFGSFLCGCQIFILDKFLQQLKLLNIAGVNTLLGYYI